MGVISDISLKELNPLFPSYHFIRLKATRSGIIDTTYIAYTQTQSYILKKYERAIEEKIAQDTALLEELSSKGLNVPVCLEESHSWYLYKRLKGVQPHNVKSYHIQALARFLAQLHSLTVSHTCDSNKIIEQEVLTSLRFCKSHYFSYYKKFEFLQDFTIRGDALIHGDIFKDNTIFNGRKIGVIDFIDSSYGTFSYDAAVALVGFDARGHQPYFINLFLNTYNQHAPKKIKKKRLLYKMKIASHFYALKRVYRYKNTFRAKKLLGYKL